MSNESGEDGAAPEAAGGKRKKKAKATKSARQKPEARTRIAKPFPSGSFEEVIQLAEKIQSDASGQPVKRETLLGLMGKSAASSASRELITSSSKYGLTSGSYAATEIALTPKGALATSPNADPIERTRAQFELAIASIEPFNKLYETFKSKKLPAKPVLLDTVQSFGRDEIDRSEIVDTFLVNAKFLGLLKLIDGSEQLLTIDSITSPDRKQEVATTSAEPTRKSAPTKTDWSTTCFYLAPIGDEASEYRKHSDLFLGALVEPAVKELGLTVVRADKIGDAGLITSQIIEYIMRARLAIVDLSFHNPNAFYEMAIRHACKLPIVQITRKQDRLPFDVNQVRTIVIDTSDIYTLVPRLDTYRAEIATQVRSALADGAVASNPISVFFPDYEAMKVK